MFIFCTKNNETMVGTKILNNKVKQICIFLETLMVFQSTSYVDMF